MNFPSFVTASGRPGIARALATTLVATFLCVETSSADVECNAIPTSGLQTWTCGEDSYQPVVLTAENVEFSITTTGDPPTVVYPVDGHAYDLVSVTCPNSPNASTITVKMKHRVNGVWSDWSQKTLSCFQQQVAEVPQPIVRAEWEYCTGNVPVFFISWSAAPGTVGPVTFKLEQRVNFVWMPGYEGSGTHVFFACPSRTYFRIKAINASGSSSWRYFWAVKDCGSGSGFPD